MRKSLSFLLPKICLSVTAVVLCFTAQAFAEKPIVFGTDASRVKVGEPGGGYSTWSTGHKSLAVRGNKVYAVWDGVNFARSDDRGGMWGRTIPVTGSNNGWAAVITAVQNPDFPIDPNKTILHLVWTNYPYMYYSRSLDDGQTWTVPSTLNSYSTDYPASVTADDYGTVYAAWQTGGMIHVQKSTDAGATWVDNTVSSQAHSAHESYIKMAGGKVHLAWYGNDHVGMYYSSSTDGANWSPEVRVNATIQGYYGSLDALDANHVYVGWWGTHPTLGDGMACAFSSDGGATWGEGFLATTDGSDPSIAVSPSGEISMAWAGPSGPGTIKLSRSTDGGATWRAPVVADTHQGTYPSLAVDSNSKALIMWATWQEGVTAFIREK